MRVKLIDLVSVDQAGNLTVNNQAFETLTETFKKDRLGAAYETEKLYQSA